MRILTLVVLVLVATPVMAQEWNTEQRAIIDALAELSAATEPGGGGPAAYAEVLAEDFSRWTMGADQTSGREAWISGIEEWWSDGWRVVERKGEIREITVDGTRAFVRRIACERFRGPDGETGDLAGAALAEVWVREGNAWKLLRADVVLLDDG